MDGRPTDTGMGDVPADSEGPRMYPMGGAVPPEGGGMEVEPRSRASPVHRLATNGPAPGLRSCAAKLLARIHNDWVLDFGTREIRLLIEYQDGVPVLIRVADNTVREEKLR